MYNNPNNKELSHPVPDNWNNYKSLSAPEQHQVIDWLLKEHGVWISVNCFTKKLGNKKPLYYYEIRIYGEQFIKNANITFKSPQEAYSATFDYIKKTI